MAETPATFPEVQGGGSLIIAWQVKGKHVLVVGGGEVSNEHLLSKAKYLGTLIPVN